MKLSTVCLIGVILVAGCTSDRAPPALDAVEADRYVPAVVAIIDSGINPYHDHFRSSGIPGDVLDRFVNSLDGAAPQRVNLTRNGDYDERLRADEHIWNKMEQARLYYFEGTNVLGISFDSGTPVLDEAGHGTGTAGAVIDANPDAIVVMVQGTGDPDGEAWAATQDWIDILSESYGPSGSLPGSGPLMGLTTSQANKLAWDNGKLPVGAADNTPSLAPNDETAGPPWVIGVSGDNPDESCREHVSGTFPDFTADFTQELPEAETIDDYRFMSGTSFATPTTAGTLSAIVQGVRQAAGWSEDRDGTALAIGPGGTITNADVRDALNRTASYLDFQPCASPRGTPVNPVAPWLQMGWGHVGSEIVNASVDHLLGIKEAPEKPAGAVAFQELMFRYRQETWAIWS